MWKDNLRIPEAPISQREESNFMSNYAFLQTVFPEKYYTKPLSLNILSFKFQYSQIYAPNITSIGNLIYFNKIQCMSQTVTTACKYTRTHLKRFYGSFSCKTFILCHTQIESLSITMKLRHNNRFISLLIRSTQQWRKQTMFNMGVSRKS